MQSISTGKYVQIPQNQNQNTAILNANGGSRGDWELFSYAIVASAKEINAYQGTAYGTGTFSVESAVDCSANNYCTPQQLALYDTFQWHLTLAGRTVINSEGSRVGGLLKPTGCVQNSDGYVTVVVSWLGRQATKDAADNGSTFEKNCGTVSSKRRQVTLSAHIY